MQGFDLRPIFWLAVIGIGVLGALWMAAPPLAAAALYWLAAPRFGWSADWRTIFAWAFVVWLAAHLVCIALVQFSGRRP